MKHLALMLLLALPVLGFAQGNIKGVIVDAENLTLPGATVFIESLETGTVTNNVGSFLLTGIPAGTHELQVSYIGYQPVTQTVTVVDGQTEFIEVKLLAGVDLGVNVLVLGDRLKGQARAINQQKTNLNITNIVAADQIGRFPDANIGDAVKRIPGITIQNDQGEARNIIVRGLAPQLNSVMINGERIPSAEGDNRNIQMDLIPADMIQTIEVNKAVTPDMDADAIGGAVNLVTRQAPADQRLSLTAASGLNLLSQKPIWTGGLVYGNRFFDDKLGVVLSGSYNNHDFGSDNVEFEWKNEVESPLSGEDIEVDPFVEEQQIRTYLVQRVRRSASANFDLRLNEKNTIFLRTMYNWRDDWENRYRVVYKDIEPIFQDGTETITGWEGIAERETKGGLNNDRNRAARLEDQRVVNVSLRGEHLIGNRLRMDWMGTYARASEERLNERYITYANENTFPLSYDLSDPMFPNIAPQDPKDMAFNLFELNELTEETQYTQEEDLIGRMNFEYPIQLGGQKGSIKFGAAYRDKTKFRDNNFFEYSPVGDDIETLEDITRIDQTKDNFLAGDQYEAGEYADPEFLGDLDLTNGNQFEQEEKPDEFLGENYDASEVVTAGYLMWQQNIANNFSAIVGVRVENTQNEYTGNQIEDEENLVGQVTATSSYLNVLPGVHLKYNATENLVLRAAWTNTLARPNYFDLVPVRSIIAEDEEIFEGNPDLNPTTSMNFDLMVENYFRSIGLVSGGVFYKDVSDFIYTSINESYVDDQITGGDEWTYFQPLNGGDATLLGFEIAFQRQLDFLPGFLQGFGVYANYTYTTSTANGVANEDGELRDDLALPGTSPHMVNASLSYENEKLVLRASLNYAHDYVDEVGGSAFTDRFYDRQLFIDVNASYAFTPKLRFFAEANNLTNQPLRYYQGARERTMQMEYYNSRFNAGFKFDLF
jgi:TonB-dependent receptor